MERRWGQRGSPWEFNLRDMFRWCELMQADQSPGFYNPGQHVALVYADRMRTEADKAQVRRKKKQKTEKAGVQQRGFYEMFSFIFIAVLKTNGCFRLLNCSIDCIK